MNPLQSLAKMVNYVDNHFDAGHDLNNPKLVTDLFTLRDDLNVVLDSFGPPASADQKLSFIAREIVKIEKSIVKIEKDQDRILELLEDTDSFF